MARQQKARHPKTVAAERTAGAWWSAAIGIAFGSMTALVIYAPASWLALAIELATRGKVQLLQTQGTIWQGSGALVLSAGGSGNSAMAWPSRWQWRIAPKGLGMHVQLQSACCTSEPIMLHLKMSGVYAQPAALEIPLSVLQGLGTPWNTLQLQGDLQLKWQSMHMPWTVEQAHWQGNAQVHALRVSTSLTTLPEVGSYQVDIQGGASPSFHVSTLKGALHIEGAGHWRQGRWRFEGQAFAQPQQAQALANLLNLLGHRSGDKTKIKWG